MLKQSIAGRLALVVGLAIALILAVSGWFLTERVGQRAVEVAQLEMDNLLATAGTAIAAYDDQLNTSAEQFSGLFGENFQGAFALERRETVTVAGERVPMLTVGGRDLAGDYRTVDRFAEVTGGNATIFVRRGQDFVRLITSVKKQDGSRAVGTLLDRASPAYGRNIDGQAFTGKVTLFGRQYITNYTPIKDAAGEVIGIRYVGISFEQSLQSLKSGLSKLVVGNRGHVFVINTRSGDDRGQFLIHPSAEGQNLSRSDQGRFVGQMLERQHGRLTYAWTAPGQGEAIDWQAHFTSVPELDWIIAVAQPLDDLHEVSNWLNRQMLITTLVIVATVSLLLWYAVKWLVGRPLSQAVRALETIAGGDYSQVIDIRGRDETAQLLQALARMQQQIREVLRELATTAGELQQAAGNMSAASGQVAKGSSEQSHAASQIASTVEQLTVSVDRLAENSNEVHSLSEASFRTSQQGAEVVSRASRAMLNISDTVRSASSRVSELGELSGQITGILEVIETIAEQTNLLALNAAIEAARAGEQGRGFAVVADEVRSLASRTAASAREITQTVENIRKSTGDVVEVMGAGVRQVDEGARLSAEAGDSIQTIQDSAQRVNQMFMEIALMLNEQAQASTAVASNVEHIAAMTETNSAAIREVAGAAQELETMSGSLNRLLGRFRI